jgi:hypothetical protein
MCTLGHGPDRDADLAGLAAAVAVVLQAVLGRGAVLLWALLKHTSSQMGPKGFQGNAVRLSAFAVWSLAHVGVKKELQALALLLEEVCSGLGLRGSVEEDDDPLAAVAIAAAVEDAVGSLLAPPSVLAGLMSVADTGRKAPETELEGSVIPPEAEVPTAVVNPGPLAFGMRWGGGGAVAADEETVWACEAWAATAQLNIAT